MFPGGNMQQLMKKAQKMQKDLVKAQKEMEVKIYEASAGGGMVNVKVNGKHEIQSIKINPEVVDPEEIEMLEDLIMAALKEVTKEINTNQEESMSNITGGMKIPGLF